MLTKDIDLIISDISSHKVVSIPTDTVYGLSCSINNKSVAELIKLKCRDTSKGFIIISNNIIHLLQYVNISKLSPEHIHQLSTVQNTPTTWIVPARDSIMWLTGGRETIAVRLVSHKIVNSICDTLDSAIISTSANISGKTITNAPIYIDKIFSYINIFNTDVAPNNTQSTIKDLITGDIIR
jgi:L-threonylcarbamoyladenylate synthase